MKYKIIGIIIIILGLASLGGIAYIMFFSEANPGDIVGSLTGEGNTSIDDTMDDTTTINDSQGSSDSQKKIIIPTPIGSNSESAETRDIQEMSKEDLMRMAASFTERFGSYSNQSNFNNIVDLKIFMSARMKTWADSFVREKRNESKDNDIYYGITTRAIAKELIEYDEDVGRAVVKITTRRREASGTTANMEDAFTQEIIVNFVKQDGAWKVDSANWVE